MSRLLLICAMGLLVLTGCNPGTDATNEASRKATSKPTVAELIGNYPSGPSEGQPAAPPKTYTDYEQLAPLLQQQNDTTYLINFWATWCKPCLEELPLLQRLQDEQAEEPLEIILVSLDTKEEAIDRLPDYLFENRIDLPTVVLTDEHADWKQALDKNWSGELPTTIIYRNDLRFVYRRAFRTLPDVRDAVRPLLDR